MESDKISSLLNWLCFKFLLDMQVDVPNIYLVGYKSLKFRGVIQYRDVNFSVISVWMVPKL